MDGANDTQAAFYKFFFSPAGEGKDAAKEAFLKKIDEFFSVVENRLKSNKKSKLHLAGNKLIYGDIKILNFVWTFALDDISASKADVEPLLEKYANLKSYATHHRQNTFKEYVASQRTQAPF